MQERVFPFLTGLYIGLCGALLLLARTPDIATADAVKLAPATFFPVLFKAVRPPGDALLNQELPHTRL